MRRAVVAALLVSALGAAHARAQPLPATAQVPTDLTSGTDFLAMYDGGDTAWRGALDAMLVGELNGLKTANAILVMQHRAPLYCPPDKATMSGKEMLDMLRQEAAVAPGFGRLPWSLVFAAALGNSFPCPPS